MRILKVQNSFYHFHVKYHKLSDKYDSIAPDDENEADEESIQLSVEKIRKAMQQLPDGYRIILSLYLFEGYDMEEISSILHIKAASVRSQYLRGKQKLLNIINQG